MPRITGGPVIGIPMMPAGKRALATWIAVAE